MTINPYGLMIFTINHKNGVVVNNIYDFVQWL